MRLACPRPARLILRPLKPVARVSPEATLLHVAAGEHAVTLADLMFRRTALGWSARLGTDVAHEVASRVRGLMGWSTDEAVGHADRYVADVCREFQLAP